MSETGYHYAFSFHGLLLGEPNESQHSVATCPFCGKENHFFVNVETGQWDCKVCSERGNLYTFLTRYYERVKSETTERHYERLSANRGIPIPTLQFHGLAYDRVLKRWLIPIVKPITDTDSDVTDKAKSGLIGLAVWDGPDHPIIASPKTNQHLYLAGNLTESGPEDVWLCEGHWDTLAAWSIVQAGGYDIAVVGLPGATTFKRDWPTDFPFKGKNVYTFFDNDEAGRKGTTLAAKRIGTITKAMHALIWPSDTDEGYDLRDKVVSFLPENLQGKALPKPYSQSLTDSVINWIESNSVCTVSSPENAGPPPIDPRYVDITFPELCKAFKDSLYVDDQTETVLAALLATILSTREKSDPLWLFLVGPPGSGKTLIQEVIGSKSAVCHYTSVITRASLVSGFSGGGADDDPSLLPHLTGKTLVVPDYTTVLSLPAGQQEELYGNLRQIYDGVFDRPFGNWQGKTYTNTHFSLIAGVTDVIHSDERAHLGERFIKIEFLDRHNHDRTEHILAAINGEPAEKLEIKADLNARCQAFLAREHRLPPTTAETPIWFRDQMVALVQLVAYFRANVQRVRGEALSFRPQTEIGTRLIKQLDKLARYLCVVYDQPIITKRIYQLVQRIAFDTGFGWSRDIIHAISSSANPLTISQLSDRLQVSVSTIKRRVDDLVDLQALIKSTNQYEEADTLPKPSTNGHSKKTKGKKKFTKKNPVGHPTEYYTLSPLLKKLWADAKITVKPIVAVRVKASMQRMGNTNKLGKKKKKVPKKKRTDTVVTT